jgi:prepilin-type N-terminal cleavage/methylation domain-containing protein
MLLWRVRKSNSGFTLIEMLVVVIILGVIAAVAVPNLLGLLNRNRVNEAMRQVEGALKEAQKQASRRGRTCKILFTSSGTGDNKSSLIQVRPDETLPDGTIINYSGCLLSTRELANSVSFSLLDSGTLKLIDENNTADLGFSTKGNPDVQGIMVISHPGSNTQKCVQITGLLGTMITGDYNQDTQECKAQ